MLEQEAEDQITLTKDKRPYIYPSITEESKWMPNEVLIESPREVVANKLPQVIVLTRNHTQSHTSF